MSPSFRDKHVWGRVRKGTLRRMSERRLIDSGAVMAGKNSRAKKERRTKAQKKRNRRSVPEGGMPERSPFDSAEEKDSGGGGMMTGMRSGFKKVAGTSNSQKQEKGSWTTMVVSAVLTAGALIVILKFADCQ